ncbi:MAG: YjeF-related protein [Bacteroidetes bacterium]|nr:YjeF-related protein [Bacteroidota bacterium]
MQQLVTADQMQKLDRTAINKLGIPGLVLMENAGRAFVDELANRITPLAGKRVMIVCGKGNNGGDGYVIARHLLNRGCEVEVVLLCKRNEVKGDAKTNLDILFKLSPHWKTALGIIQITSASQLNRLRPAEVIVDAIFGTGFRGKAEGLSEQAIRWINKRKVFVAAVDICSGADASTGVVEGEAVKADLTVTMGLAKVGQFVGAGREHSGEVVVADISIPKIVIEQEKVQTYRVTSDDIRAGLPRRTLTAHKYSVGKVFVLAGSRKFTGAPFMCAQAAMRTGAGAVILGTPRSIQPILARKFTEVMIAPLDETVDGNLSLSGYEAILERIAWADVVAIGPGLSRATETLELVLKLLLVIKKPIVLDADALAVVASNPKVLVKRKEPTIITPHAGELSEIIGKSVSEIDTLRVKVCRNSASQLRSIVCLKGSPTVTATPTGQVYLNSTGNPGMATIGSGDVLTGIIASLVAQGMTPEEAASSGVFIHGISGDLASSKLGERSIMALDILDRIPDALRTLE